MLDVAFTPNQYYFAINENSNSTTTIGNVFITTNRDVTTSFATSSQNFEVTTSGQLSLQENIVLDYENTSQRLLTASITENTVSSVTADVIICLIDLNDNPPSIPSPSSLTIQVSVSQLNSGNVIVRFYSIDPDSNRSVTYSLTNETVFSITSAGVLQNIISLDPDTHNVTVVAQDAGTPSMSSSVLFSLTITNDSSEYTNI